MIAGKYRTALFGSAVVFACACAASAEADVHAFDVPAEDAALAFTDFALQAGRQIVAPGQMLSGLKTPAVHGTYETSAALAILLKGLPLDVVSDDGQTIVVKARPSTPPEIKRDTERVTQPIEAIVVNGYRASLTNAANAKHLSVVFSDTIFAEDIGKFPDSNIAESFNRIPGVTITREIDGSGVNVSIRGLGPNFTKVLLNGAQISIASTGPTNSSDSNREVDLNVFPVELFTQLIVNKSSRAADIEGGAAGTLNMRSMRPFDNPGLHLTYSIKGSDLSNQNAVSPDGALILSDTKGHYGILLGATTTASRLFTTGFESVGWTNPNLATSGSVIQCAPAASCNSTGGGNWNIPIVVPNNVTTGGLAPGHVIDEAYLLSMNPGTSISQIDSAIVPRIGRYFREKGVRSRYNGITSLEYDNCEGLHVYIDAIAARLSNAFDRSDMDFAVRNGGAIPTGEIVNPDGVATSATFANAQWILEARPYHEHGDFVSINPGLEWQPSDRLEIALQANASRSHFFRDVSSILVSTAPSSGNPAGVSGATVPPGGIYVNYAIPDGSSVPVISTNVDLNNPQNFQWAGGRVNITDEKRYTYTNGIHADIRYGGDSISIKAGFAFDQDHRVITAYDNSQAWQNAVCGNQPNLFLAYPNSQPPCQGLDVAGSAQVVNSIVPGYPTYPGLGTHYSVGSPSLSYGGSLIPQNNLATYLHPNPGGFIGVDYDRFNQDSHYAAFDYPNAPISPTSNLAVSSGMIDEKIYGVYEELNGTFPLYDRSLKYNVGLRWVATYQTVSGPISTPDPRNVTENVSLDGALYPNQLKFSNTRHNYQAILPAMNVVYEISDRLQVRASLSRTLNRPDPSSIVPGISFSDPSAAQAILGNTALSPYYSNNIDLGAEIYTGDEGYAGLALFHKSISGFTVTDTSTQPFSFLADYGITYDTLTPTQQAGINARGGPGAATIQVSEQVNARGLLTINGIELTYIQPLDFLLAERGLSGLGFSGNLTLIDQGARGSAPVKALGISPYSYNLTAYYEQGGVSLRASYVFYDKQVAGGTDQNGICLPSVASQNCPGGAYIYNNAFAQLDVSSSLKLASLFGGIPSDPELVFSVQNLTKSTMRTYFQYPEAAYNYYAPGSTYVFGVRGSF